MRPRAICRRSPARPPTRSTATLGPFTRDEVAEFLAQHTQATGQRFAAAAVDRVFALGAGHPWLTGGDVLDDDVAYVAGLGLLAEEGGRLVIANAIYREVIPRALDLMIHWRGARHAIEVKLRRDTEAEADALDQVARYLDIAGLEEGSLIMFDLRREMSWQDRIWVRGATQAGKRIRGFGC